MSVDVSLHPSFRARDNLKQEVQMSIRIATAAAFALTFASPALADCNQELKALEQNVVSAGSGASTSEAGAGDEAPRGASGRQAKER